MRIGHGQGIVVGTGSQTEFGVVFSMVREAETPKTPFQLSMNELGKKLSYLSGGIIIVIVIIGIIQGREWLEMFTIGGHYLNLYSFFFYVKKIFKILLVISYSKFGRRCYSRRPSDCCCGNFGVGNFKNGKKKCYYKEIAICRNSRICQCDLCR